jgi:hypothetical protein
MLMRLEALAAGVIRRDGEQLPNGRFRTHAYVCSTIAELSRAVGVDPAKSFSTGAIWVGAE